MRFYTAAWALQRFLNRPDCPWREDFLRWEARCRGTALGNAAGGAGAGKRLSAKQGSAGLATTTLPTVVQPVWIDQGSMLNLGFALADGLGHATASWAIPAGTAFIDRSLWFQGVSGSNLPLQLSQVTGGVVRQAMARRRHGAVHPIYGPRAIITRHTARPPATPPQ